MSPPYAYLTRYWHHCSFASMASHSAPHERSKISWEFSEADDSRSSSPASARLPKNKAETVCTRFSLATTNFASATPSPEAPALTFVEALSQSPQTLQRRSTTSPWSLLCSTRSTNPGSQRNTALAPSARDQTKSKRSSRWWSPNRPVSKNDKMEQRIAPPIPPRPEPLWSTKSPEPNASPKPVSASVTTRHDPSWKPQPLSQIREHPQYLAHQKLADLDPDKRDSEFARINPEGWDKVVPKHWMEDHFSHTSSSIDEEGSVYSQDNGEEEAKRRLTSRLASAVKDHGFLAGEATPFDPLSDIQVEAPSEAPTPDSIVTKSREAPDQGGTRWPFEGSLSSSPRSLPTSSSVHHWLSSIRPPSEVRPSSSYAPKAEVNTRGSSSMSQNVLTRGEPLQLSDDEISISEVRRKRLSNVKNLRKVKLSDVRDHHTLVPEPLTLRPRAAASLTTIQTLEQSTSLGGELAPLPSPPNLPPQVPPTLNSSWSTIKCTRENESLSFLEAPPFPTSLQSKRESDRNKPLPLPPSEANTPAQSVIEKPKSRTNSLTDTIDEILDLYYYCDSESNYSEQEQQPQPQPPAHRLSEQQQQQSEPSAPHACSSTASPSTIQSQGPTRTPQKRPPRTPDTEFSPPPSFGANMPRQGDARFVAAYPIFYDTGSYPELGHGQAVGDRRGEDDEGSRDRPRRGSGRAVVTFVDEMGGTWI